MVENRRYRDGSGMRAIHPSGSMENGKEDIKTVKRD